MAADAIVFNEASFIFRGYYQACSLTISEEGFEINVKGRKQFKIPTDQIKSVSWCQMAKGHGIKISCEKDLFYQVCSLDSFEFDRISQFLDTKLNIYLKKQEISVKGKNQGDFCIDSSSIKFDVDNQTCLEVPYKDVCRVTSSKNEIGLEFHPLDEAPVSLMEMRFHVPNESVKRLQEELSSKADVIKATSDSIYLLPDVFCMIPRGRFTLRVYTTFLELHGKSMDFKIPYSSVRCFFLVQGTELKTNLVVLAIEPAIRQGQTRYPFIVIQFEDHLGLYLTVSPDYYISTNGSETKIAHTIFCDIIERLCSKKLSPNGDFKSHNKNPFIPCSCKTSNGYLYPLEQGFLFVYKPPSFTRFNEIGCIDFARGTLSARTFDMELNLVSGQTILFNNIDRENYVNLHQYCVDNKIRIRKASEKVKLAETIEVGRQDTFKANARLEDSDIEDADYNPYNDESSSEEEIEQTQQVPIVKSIPAYDPNRFVGPF